MASRMARSGWPHPARSLGGEMPRQALPFGVGEIGRIDCIHAWQRTGSPLTQHSKTRSKTGDGDQYRRSARLWAMSRAHGYRTGRRRRAARSVGVDTCAGEVEEREADPSSAFASTLTGPAACAGVTQVKVYVVAKSATVIGVHDVAALPSKVTVGSTERPSVPRKLGIVICTVCPPAVDPVFGLTVTFPPAAGPTAGLAGFAAADGAAVLLWQVWLPSLPSRQASWCRDRRRRRLCRRGRPRRRRRVWRSRRYVTGRRRDEKTTEERRIVICARMRYTSCLVYRRGPACE